MNGDRAFIAVVAVFVAVLILIWRRNYYRSRRVRPLPRELDLARRRYTLAELLAADPRDPGTWPGVPPLHPADDRPSEPACGPVTHLLPPESEGEYLTVCCGRSPFDLAADREPLTIRPENVTCGECGRRS